jgi:hypothetical protein
MSIFAFDLVTDMFFESKIDKTPSAQEIVQSFVDSHYPDLILHPKMMEQLLWLQDNSVNTSQSSVQSKKEEVNLEVKRILSRLYCLKLLENGNLTSYQSFIQAQAPERVLCEADFTRLSHFIQVLSPASRQALMATCFITKSDQAVKVVPVAQKAELPADSEQFITHMVTHFADVFPICALLNEDERALLPYAFYKNAHARQILDMEGGQNMITSIAEGIRTRAITYEQFNLWFARWIINVAGLDGHINAKGSIYLTQPVADCIFALKLELDQLWGNPEHQVLNQYLTFRATQLNVTNPYVAYFGALMRQYTPSMGREIQAWFFGLSESAQLEHQSEFDKRLKQTKVTPSFKPTVLVNLLGLGCSVSDALTIFTQVESNATEKYLDAVGKGLIPDTTPLSFRNIAFKESLAPILDYYKTYGSLPVLEIDCGGYLSVTPEALQHQSTIIFSISL